MNHYCPNKFYAHIAQGLILEAKVLDEMILDPGAEVMNVDRMPSPSSAPARRHDDTTTTEVVEEILLLHLC